MSCENEFRDLVAAVIGSNNRIGDTGRGARADDPATIRALQTVLQNTRFGAQVTPSGIMDDATRNALKDLQSNAGMRTPSGVVDVTTLGYLAQATGLQSVLAQGQATGAGLTTGSAATAPAPTAPSTSAPTLTGPTYSPARGLGLVDAVRDLTLAVRGGNPIGDGRNDSPQQIEALQAALIAAGRGTNVRQTGQMDAATRAGLTALQTANGLPNTRGVLDQQTLTALAGEVNARAMSDASVAAPAPTSSAPTRDAAAGTSPSATLQRPGTGIQDDLREISLAVRNGNPIDGRGDSAELIAATQRALNATGRFNVPVTGQWGRETATAIGSLQRAEGRTVTGRIDSETLGTLTSLVTANGRSNERPAPAGPAVTKVPAATLAPTPTPTPTPAPVAAAPAPAPSAPARGGNLPTPPGNPADWTPLTIGGRSNGRQFTVTTQSGDTVAIMRNGRTGDMWVPPSYAPTPQNLQTIVQAGAQQAVLNGDAPSIGTLAGRVPEPSQLPPADPALARPGNPGDGRVFAYNAEGQQLAQAPGFQPSPVHSVATTPVIDSQGIAGGRASTDFSALREQAPEGGTRPGAAMRTVPVDVGRAVSSMVGPDGIVARGATPSPAAATAATPASSGRPGLTGAAASAPLQSPLGVLSQAVSSGNAIGDGRGDTPAQVTALQQALIAAGRGGIVGAADGRNGAATRAAVSAVQAQAGLAQTGVVNAATLAALSSEVAAQGQGAVAQAVGSSPALASALSANPGARTALAQAVAQTPSLGAAIAGNSSTAQAIATTPGLAQAALASPALAAAMAADPAIATSLAGNPGQVASLASNPSMVSAVVAAFSSTPSVSSTPASPAGLPSTPGIAASLAGLPPSVASQLSSGNEIGALASIAATLSSVPDIAQTPSGTPGGQSGGPGSSGPAGGPGGGVR